MRIIQATNLTPYISLLLAQSKKKSTKTDALSIATEIESVIRSREDVLQASVNQSKAKTDGKLSSIFLTYTTKKPPAWTSVDHLNNIEHHLIVISCYDSYAGMHFSDAGLREVIAKSIADPLGTHALNDIELVAPDDMTAAFIGPKARRLWLGGVHRRVSIKPDSKILSGIELENALDPLSDQTYCLSAIRSSPDMALLKRSNGSIVSLGTAPEKSRIWLGPTDDWPSFANATSDLLERLKNTRTVKTNTQPIYNCLAQRVTDVSSVKDPYDVAIVPWDLLAEDAALKSQDRHEALRWAYGARLDIKSATMVAHSTPGMPDKHLLNIDAFLEGEHAASFNITISFSKKGRASITISKIKVLASSADGEEKVNSILRRHDWFVIYFDSGHTVSTGAVYSTRHRDMRFSSWEYAKLKPAYNVRKEKPDASAGPLATSIGLPGGSSLFCYIAHHWPNIDKPGNPDGWLACDDGSMEMADFIHVDDKTKTVSLIHVKASKSDKDNRELSTSDYEVVVGQAIKNLRYLDQRNLSDELRHGKGKKIGTAVWHNGKGGMLRDDFIKAVEALGADYDRSVVVFQPRSRAKEIERVEKLKGSRSSPVLRKLQLDGLLLEAQMAAHSLGATFRVIGEDDR